MSTIQLTWLGHSCFKVSYEGGTVVIDPFEPGSVPGLEPVRAEAQEVLCSHEHHDHGYRQAVKLLSGEHGFSVRKFSSFHDAEQGKLRGENTIFLLEAGNISVAHMGDVGCIPTPEICEALRGVDALMIPVGGYYTAEIPQILEILKKIEPRVVVPMHYRTADFGYDVIGTLDAFLAYQENIVHKADASIEIFPNMPSQTVVLKYEGSGR